MMEISPNAPRAGGHDESGGIHAGKPHVYVVYWPEFGVIKVGVTKHGDKRWGRWFATGAE